MTSPAIFPGDPATSTIAEAQQFTTEHLVVNGAGSICPVTYDLARLVRRKVEAKAARMLIEMYFYFLNPDDSYWDFYRDHPKYSENWFHIPTMEKVHPDPEVQHCAGNREHGRMKHWKIVELRKGRAGGGEPTAGYYRITDKGRRFVRNKFKLFRFRWIYNDRTYAISNGEIYAASRVDEDGYPVPEPPEYVSIIDALGDDFEYSEIIPPGIPVRTVSEIRAIGEHRASGMSRNIGD